MKKEKLLFIVNTHAGKGRISEKLAEIIEMYSASEYEVIVHCTLSKNDAADTAYDYCCLGACDRIVCAGGDGTIDEVAGAVMRSGAKIPIGIISAGSTNDFGYTLGIPNTILGAAKLAITGSPFPCDIAAFNGRYFTYTAAFGLFADVSYDTPQQFKNAFGRLAYIMNGMTKLPQIRIFRMKVEYDGIEVEEDYILGMVVSSSSVGGFRGIMGSAVSLNDGLYEMLLVRNPKNIAGMTAAVNQVMNHRYDGEYVRYAHVDKVVFTSDEEIAWSLDGEYGGSTTRAEINVVKEGIQYITKEAVDE